MTALICGDTRLSATELRGRITSAGIEQTRGTLRPHRVGVGLYEVRDDALLELVHARLGTVGVTPGDGET